MDAPCGRVRHGSPPVRDSPEWIGSNVVGLLSSRPSSLVAMYLENPPHYRMFDSTGIREEQCMFGQIMVQNDRPMGRCLRRCATHLEWRKRLHDHRTPRCVYGFTAPIQKIRRIAIEVSHLLLHPQSSSHSAHPSWFRWVCSRSSMESCPWIYSCRWV